MSEVESIKKEIHIVGGGISGLFTAYYLTRAGFPVTVFEKEPRLGGLLGTHQNPFGFVEQAANAFIANKELEDVGREIGVTLLEKKPTANKRYIYRKNKARRWPLGFFASLRVFIFLLGFWMYKSFFKPKPRRHLREWGELFLGKTATDYLLAPAIQGIYATDPKNLSASLVLKQIFLDKQERGELKGSVAAAGGMGEFVSHLKQYLEKKGCRFKLNSHWEWHPDLLTVLTCDLQSVKPILKKIKPEYFELFKNLPSSSLTSVTLQFEKDKDLIEGFGCLFPAKERFHSLGVLFNHHIFEGRAENYLSETWILNDHNMKISSMDEDSIVSLVLQDRKKLHKITQKPLRSSIFQWKERIPVYNLDLERVLEKYKHEPPVYLMGNYLGDLGLSKILLRAKELAMTIEKDSQWER